MGNFEVPHVYDEVILTKLITKLCIYWKCRRQRVTRLIIDAVWDILLEKRLTCLVVLEQCGVFADVVSSSTLSFSADFSKPDSLPIAGFDNPSHLHPCLFSVRVMDT